MPPRKPPGERPLENGTLTVEAQIGPVHLDLTLKGLDRRPLLSLLDEIVGSVEGEKRED